jgi:hypothetical protein
MFIVNRIILLLLASPAITLFAQDEDDKRFAETRIQYHSIGVPPVKVEAPVPVSAIHVYDSRFDTTCIGVVKNALVLTTRQLNKPAASVVRDFYVSVLPANTSGEIELHCFLKKLVISDNIDVENKDKNAKPASAGSDEQSGALLTVDFYAKKDDQFFALYRFDSILTGKKDIGRGGSEYLETIIHASIQKIQRINISKALTGKKISWDDIRQFNEQRLKLAVLETTPAKGIYMNFADFCSNKVLNKEFTIDRGTKGDFLYVKNDSNQDILVDDAWGYSDGKNIYVYSSNNYFKLYRTGNSFKILGAKDYSHSRSLNILKARPVDLISPNSNFSKEQTTSKYNLVKEYLQLDMESGKLY